MPKQGVRRGLLKTGMTPPYRTTAAPAKGLRVDESVASPDLGWRGIRMVAFPNDPL